MENDMKKMLAFLNAIMWAIIVATSIRLLEYGYYFWGGVGLFVAVTRAKSVWTHFLYGVDDEREE